MKAETKDIVIDVAYPHLRVCYGSCIVLFTAPRTGMVVISYAPALPVGYYSTVWDCTMFRFDYLRDNVQVVLSND